MVSIPLAEVPGVSLLGAPECVLRPGGFDLCHHACGIVYLNVVLVIVASIVNSYNHGSIVPLSCSHRSLRAARSVGLRPFRIASRRPTTASGPRNLSASGFASWVTGIPAQPAGYAR